MIDVLQTLDRFLGRVAMDESEGQWLHHCDRLVPIGSKEQGSGLNPGVTTGQADFLVTTEQPWVVNDA